MLKNIIKNLDIKGNLEIYIELLVLVIIVPYLLRLSVNVSFFDRINLILIVIILTLGAGYLLNIKFCEIRNKSNKN